MPISNKTVATDIPHLQSSRGPRRENPFPGTWIAYAETFRPPLGTTSLEWVFEFENPWFPSVLVQGPEVILTTVHPAPDEYRWIVMWWTERLGPVSLVVRL